MCTMTCLLRVIGYNFSPNSLWLFLIIPYCFTCMQHATAKCLCLTFDPEQIWIEWAHSLSLSHIIPLVFLLPSVTVHTGRYKLVWEQTHWAETLVVVKTRFKGFYHQLFCSSFSAQGISPHEGGFPKKLWGTNLQSTNYHFLWSAKIMFFHYIC